MSLKSKPTQKKKSSKPSPSSYPPRHPKPRPPPHPNPKRKSRPKPNCSAAPSAPPRPRTETIKSKSPHRQSGIAHAPQLRPRGQFPHRDRRNDGGRPLPEESEAKEGEEDGTTQVSNYEDSTEQPERADSEASSPCKEKIRGPLGYRWVLDANGNVLYL